MARIWLEDKVWKLETDSGVVSDYPTEREAIMAQTIHPVSLWQDKATPLIEALNNMLTGRAEVNEIFIANDVVGYILRGLAADSSGNGPMLDEAGSPVGTWTCLKAATTMHLMSNIEVFLQAALEAAKKPDGTSFDELPLPALLRWVAIRRSV